MQRVKGMKEFFLGAFFAGDELYIVDEQYVSGTILFAKVVSSVRANGVNQVVGELLRAGIEYF